MVNGIRTIGAVLLIAVTLCIFFASGSRWLGLPLTGMFDLAKITFIWMSFFGAALAVISDRHFQFDIVTKLLPGSLQLGLKVLTRLAIVLFLGMLIPIGIDLTLSNYQRTMGYLPISYSWVTAALPFGAALLILANVLPLLRRFFRSQPSERK